MAHCIFNVTECGAMDWFCDHEHCIAGHFVCDGYEDCWDGTDEDLDNCPTGICILSLMESTTFAKEKMLSL